jgi:NAD(P)-dependent dehydrogenase (short-subunit alcohol dehydrogenase family)
MTIKSDRTEFADKCVLVSGRTKGLGRATVERFVAGGAHVVAAARAVETAGDRC